MQKEWKQQFKDKMEGFGEPAPEGLWESIESSIESAQNKKEKRVIMFLSSLTAAAAALLIAVLGPGPGSNNTDNSNTIVENISDYNISGDLSDNAAVEVAGTDMPAELHDNALSANTEYPHIITEENPTNSKTEDTIEKSYTEDTATESSNQESIENSDPGSEKWNEILFNQAREDAKKAKSSDINISLFASTIGSGKTASSGYDAHATAISTAEPMLYGKSSLADIMMFNRTKDVNTNSKHYLPVRTGVSVSWQFSERWSLQTGVSYAWLLSRFRSGSDSYYYTTRQNLHYIGIPLNIRFKIWNSNIFEIYASAGGMMEKCVGGSLEKEYFYGNVFRSRESEKISVKPLQWSVSVNAGIQANITKLLAVYAEPGAIYYFKNSSPVETAFSENPFNFNFSIGFRFNL